MLAACVLALSAAAADAATRTIPTRGELRLLVVRAAFADRPLTEPADRFAGTPTSLVDRLADYYAEVSTGRLRIVPTLASAVVALPEPRARYVQRPGALAADAIRAFAAAATAERDRRALADANAVVVFFPGPGRESYMHAGETGDPWSNFTELAPPVEGFGAAIVVAATEYEDFSPFGVLCHEFGHLLGLPELYAPGGAMQEGIGKWGLMGQGTWIGLGNRPPHMEAWSKLRLGWVDVQTIEDSTLGVRLPAVTQAPLVVMIPAVQGKPKEYYLLENRELEGYDAGLPAPGILVWHVDESVESFRNAQTNPEHKLLHLVEADGRGDLDRGTRRGGNRGDAGDPWVGPPRWRRRLGNMLGLAGAAYVAITVYRLARVRSLMRAILSAAVACGMLWTGAWLRRGPECGPGTPGMEPYGGAPVAVVLRNFSPAGPVMHVDVLAARAPDAPTTRSWWYPGAVVAKLDRAAGGPAR